MAITRSAAAPASSPSASASTIAVEHPRARMKVASRPAHTGGSIAASAAPSDWYTVARPFGFATTRSQPLTSRLLRQRHVTDALDVGGAELRMIRQLEATGVDAVGHGQVLGRKTPPPVRLARHVAAAQRARLDPRVPQRATDTFAVVR